MGANRANKKILSVLTITGTLITTQAVTQEAGQPLLVLRFAEGLELSDNPDLVANPSGTVLSSRTSLGLNFSSETSNQSLEFDAGLDLLYELANSGDDPYDNGVTDPFARLDYSRESATAKFDFAALYAKTDVGDLTFVTDPNSGDIVLDEGEVERTRFDLGLETGIDAPFGVELDAFYQKRIYTGTVDPDNVDDETLSARARLRFSIDQATDISLIGRYERNQELEGSDYERDTQAIGLGFDRALDEATRIDLEVTSDEIETTEDGTTDRTTGISAILGFERDLPTGDFRVELASIVQDDGKRNTLRFDRGFELPDGNLSIFAGVTNNEITDVRGIFGVEYLRELDDSTLSARVSQTFNQDIDSSDEFRNRLLSVGFQQQVNSVSSWGADALYVEADNLNDGTSTKRTNFSVNYSRDITQDWQVVTGYSYEESRSSTDARRESNTVFLRLERDFSVRP